MYIYDHSEEKTNAKVKELKDQVNEKMKSTLSV